MAVHSLQMLRPLPPKLQAQQILTPEQWAKQEAEKELDAFLEGKDYASKPYPEKWKQGPMSLSVANVRMNV
jgi:hypothetical protein